MMCIYHVIPMFLQDSTHVLIDRIYIYGRPTKNTLEMCIFPIYVNQRHPPVIFQAIHGEFSSAIQAC